MPLRKQKGSAKKNKKEIKPANPPSFNKSFHIEFKNEAQSLAWAAFKQYDVLFLIGPAGCGKTFLASAFAIEQILNKQRNKIILTRPIVEAGESLGFLPGPQPLTAKIATPYGWTTMGDLKLGDTVIGGDGLPTKVIGVYPKGQKDTYKITTTDGTHTVCCEDHLWYTSTFEDKKRNRKGSVKSTKEILSTLKTKKGKLNHYLPRNKPVHYNKRELKLCPYTMGVLLGDGHIGNSISFSSNDPEIAERVSKEIKKLNVSITESNIKNNKAKNYSLSSHNFSWKPARKIKITNLTNNQYDIFERNFMAAGSLGIKEQTLKRRCKENKIINNKKYEYLPLNEKYTHPIKNIMNQYGLLGLKAWQKFIPDDYKYSSISDRINILRGLMDTDGTVVVRKGRYSEASFATTSKQLADDVIEVVRSLGGRAVIRERNRIGKKSVLQNSTTIVAKRVSYEFTVSLPNKINPFYIKRKANKFKTNYLHQVKIKSIEKLGNEKVQCIRVDNKEHLYLTDDFIVTHNTFEDKVNPYMMPIYDCMDHMIGPDGPSRERINNAVEVAPIAFMRGRSFNNSICIFDEAQNASYLQLKLFLTRFGENSKIIITGDPTQSDIGSKVALVEVVQRLKNVNGIGVLEFKNDSIVRHSLVGKIIERLE